MPIYEYQCSTCGHKFDKLQKLADQPLVDCPQCSKPELQKLVSAAGFRLKGSGWYETDFKSKNQKNVVKSEVKKSETKKPEAKKSASGDGK